MSRDEASNKQQLNSVGKSILFLLLACLAGYQLWISLLEQRSFTKSSQHSLLSRYSQNPYLLTAYAKRAHLKKGNSTKAQRLFQRALIHNPYFIPAWIGMCELKNNRGQTEDALKIFDYLNKITTDISRYRWEKALLGYQLEQIDTLADDLSYLITYTPSKKNQALKLAFSVWTDPSVLLEKIGNHNISHLFNYSLNKKRLVKAIAFWPVYESTAKDENKRKQVLRFIHLLMYNDHISLAKKIWRKHFQQQEGLYNSGFTYQPLQTAFGWRIHNQQGSKWEIISDAVGGSHNGSLHVHFMGTDNINYSGVSQIVSLTPDKNYALSGLIRTQNVTTDQRPYFEVYGFKCKAKRVFTTSVNENQEWTKFTLTFNTPQECDTMMIRLRRNRSNYLDNLLSGDIWIRNLRIDIVDGLVKSPQSVIPGLTWNPELVDITGFLLSLE